MSRWPLASNDEGLTDQLGPYDPEPTPEDELWFMPGPLPTEPDFLPPLPRAEPSEREQVAAWADAQSEHAASLARVAARLGALDDRLLRGPEGWRHRLARVEASEVSWFSGTRIATDRLGLWIALRLSAADDDVQALESAAWAYRRLSRGPGPRHGLAEFLGRRETDRGGVSLHDRLAGWQEVMAAAADLHPVTRSCLAYSLWRLADIGSEDTRSLEGAVIAARMAVEEGQGGALFAPLAMGGVWSVRATGHPSTRFARWLAGLDQGALRAMRMLDRLSTWYERAQSETAALSGRTPKLLIDILLEWPLVTAPMAEELTAASRAAVQRNLAWMEERELVVEVTGFRRFRVWRVDA